MSEQRLIDLDVALKEIDDYKAMQTVSHYLSVAECKAARYGMDLAMTILRNCPTIEAPLVRCVECRYRELSKLNCKGYTICPASGMEITDDDYCSYGERREK